jgi:hypothetical protein
MCFAETCSAGLSGSAFSVKKGMAMPQQKLRGSAAKMQQKHPRKQKARCESGLSA